MIRSAPSWTRQRRGWEFPSHDARLLRLHSNASFALPSAGLVVRIATNPPALDRVAASIAVTRWLADRGFPCVIPADIDDQPLVIAGHVVSVWRYVPTADAPAPTGAEIGRLLRDLARARRPADSAATASMIPSPASPARWTKPRTPCRSKPVLAG